jgi:hypothetical protein
MYALCSTCRCGSHGLPDAFPISHLDIETYASKEKEQDGMAPQVIELKDSSHHGRTQSVQNPEFVVNVEKRQSITYSRA